MEAIKYSVHSSTIKANEAFFRMREAEIRQEEALDILLCAEADQINGIIRHQRLTSFKVDLKEVMNYNHSLLTFVDSVLLNRRLLRRKKEDRAWLEFRENDSYGLPLSAGADSSLECSYDRISNSGVRLIESIIGLIEWEAQLDGGKYAASIQLQLINMLGILHELFMFTNWVEISHHPHRTKDASTSDLLKQEWILRLNRAMLPLVLRDANQRIMVTEVLHRLQSLLNRSLNIRNKPDRIPSPPFIRAGICTVSEQQPGQRYSSNKTCSHGFQRKP
ncbi:hypothetical protein KIH86_16795 [Paenibacillus sp. HN-1]|uniref:hypothetical protein n=1 Tax=Paenibacillus TaxID=44249 RepID=UPI001CA9C236|nr:MULTISPECIES: hypothetical protein [Paenibacillus]MBY9081976.1 hypothetical protein [Paenibacillus sp. CGMCC 1.18879]MBY9085866.1 hypothetical protein [Paenibacillus sinensis]